MPSGASLRGCAPGGACGTLRSAVAPLAPVAAPHTRRAPPRPPTPPLAASAAAARPVPRATAAVGEERRALCWPAGFRIGLRSARRRLAAQINASAGWPSDPAGTDRPEGDSSDARGDRSIWRNGVGGAPTDRSWLERMWIGWGAQPPEGVLQPRGARATAQQRMRACVTRLRTGKWQRGGLWLAGWRAPSPPQTNQASDRHNRPTDRPREDGWCARGKVS